MLENSKPLLNVELTMKSTASFSGERHFLAHFYPLECGDAENRATGLVMVDVTERKVAEEAWRLSEARYCDVVEHSVYGVCGVSASGLARGANAAMLHILGCSSQEELAGAPQNLGDRYAIFWMPRKSRRSPKQPDAGAISQYL